MGSWNSTCAVSNLHITHGTKVMVLMLAKSNSPDQSFCYNNALYNLCYVPFYGENNDYGSVEECHGIGLNIVIEALRERLYRFGQGPNEYHDCEVNKDNFDIDKLFEADHESRLGVHHPYRYANDYDKRQLEKLRDEQGLTESQQYELDRLANVMTKTDDFQQVTHIQVRQDIVDAIKKDWYIEEYVGDGKGTHGYGNNYINIYFKDIQAQIPDYVARVREKHAEMKALEEEFKKDASGMSTALNKKFYRLVHGNIFDHDDLNWAGRWMQGAARDDRSSQAVVRIEEVISAYKEKEDWDSLAKFAEEVLSVMWLNSFMSYTRKIWTKQCGAGSQSSEPLGYEVLANAVLNILKEEKAEWARLNGEDEEEDVEDDVEA